MADEAPKLETPLSKAENTVNRFLNGAPCSLNPHLPMSDLEKLIMLKMLRLELPHQSTNLNELEWAIRKAAKAAQ